jgi:23S rRNA (pseudouridine1915-N3)-methyltransferase
VAIRVVFLADGKDPLLESARDYLARTDRRLKPELQQLKPARRKKNDPETKVKADEARRLLDATEGCTRIALDERGASMTSPEFSRRLERWLAAGRPVAFLIGGATGLAPEVREAADHTLSLSEMVLPHKLAVLVIAEQIYRAGEIARGSPYHKV